MHELFPEKAPGDFHRTMFLEIALVERHGLLPFYNIPGIPCDYQLFVGWNSKYLYLAFGKSQVGFFALHVVELRVDLYAKEAEPVADPLPHLPAILANSSGEDDCVELTHGNCVSADVLHYPVREDVKSK